VQDYWLSLGHILLYFTCYEMCALILFFFIFCEIIVSASFSACSANLFRWFRCILQVARSTLRVVCCSFVVAGDQRHSSKTRTLSLYVCDP